MQPLQHLTIALCLLATPLATADDKSAPAAAAAPSQPPTKTPAIDLKTVLEKGQASGALPEGMVVRVSACLGAPDGKTARDSSPAEFKETWEFTAGQIHCVRPDDSNEERAETATRPQLQSLPFDTKHLCQELLAGKAIEIKAAQGQGPEVGFIGSHYKAGSRSITVVWQGETILDLGETNGPFLKLYKETDARAFGALYEHLASQARNAFKAKPAQVR